ncbi:TPA: hypothetical protein DCR49_00725 [Candidatus Delongbacteria bacterium]|nr:MAG: hypothetical protein A2Y39_02355 [Candidatus Delongbacteria bacterium GWF2_40_14]HAQ60522.1 hypothetical protein [Candidatus Delongbacteria bacterium]
MKRMLIVIFFTTVNILFSTIYYVTQNGGGNFDGSAWENSYPGDSLQVAIDSTHRGDEVWVAKGIYKPNSWPHSLSPGPEREMYFAIYTDLYGGFSGSEIDISQRDLKNNETILSGDIGFVGDNSDNCYHIMTNGRYGSNVTVIIDGVTFTGGNAEDTYGTGSAFYNHDSELTIRNCTFHNNHSIFLGGALGNRYNYDYNTYMIVENCLFYNNSSRYGGAIFSNGESTIITNCTIVNNTAYDDGGGIYLATEEYEWEVQFGVNEVSNNIIWGNNCDTQIYQYDTGYIKFYFNAIQDGYSGFGNYFLSSNNEGDTNSPYFTDTDKNDWTLQSTSPCIDFGVYWNAPETDINLAPRPQGLIYDIGAYEFKNTEPNATLPSVSTLPAENISATYATLKGDVTDEGNAQVIAKGIKYSTSNGFDPETEGKLVRLLELIDAGAFELFVTNLSPNTIYYYRAYCENKFGYSYADNELSFTTSDSIVINPDANGIVYIKEEGTGDGSSWSNALNGYELQNGIDHPDATEIWVAKGIYVPNGWPLVDVYHGTTEREKHFRIRPNKKLYGGYNGIETSIDQRDIKENETILSGDIGVKGYSEDNCYHVIYNGGTLIDNSAVIDGFTITDGNADGTLRYSTLLGGGIYNRACSPRISKCLIKNNYAIVGGGVAVGSDPAYPIIENCTVTGNIAELYGGGIENEGAYPTIQNCLISNNTAGKEGGGIYHWAEYITFGDSDTLKIFNSTIVKNIAPIGSGIQIKSDCMTGFNREIIQNSVIWGDSSAFTFEYEALYGSIQTISYCGITGGYSGEGNIDLSSDNSGDPNSPYFSDPESGNWMIQEYSPLRDAGVWTSNVPLSDLAGFSRDAIPDIGCYEYDPTSIEDTESVLPRTTELYQNYPNPFNPATNIKFALSKSGKVELSVFNIAGQLVRKIIDKEMAAGYHNVKFEADDLNSGLYFYKLIAGGKELTKKMLMVK